MAPGQRIGRYRVLRHLGSGGMADVFLAQRDGSEKLCVLKRLNEEMQSSARAAQRLLREAEIAALLDHPGIARVLDAGHIEQHFYVAYEFISGCSLAELQEALHRPLTPLQVAAVLHPLLEALAHAHAATGPDGAPLSVVHRDLTPRNIMLTAAGEVKLIDFGVARARLGDFRTEPGMLLGTIAYMSPEQGLGLPIDHRSDLYGVGLLLYELLVGQTLVQATSVMQALEQVVQGPVPALSQLVPGLPPGLDRVLARALAKDPAARVQEASELARLLAEAGLPPASPEHLARLVRTHGPPVPTDEVRALSEPPIEPTRTARVEPTPTMVEPAPSRTRLRRRRRYGTAIAALCAASLALTLALLLRRTESTLVPAAAPTAGSERGVTPRAEQRPPLPERRQSAALAERPPPEPRVRGEPRLDPRNDTRGEIRREGHEARREPPPPAPIAPHPPAAGRAPDLVTRTGALISRARRLHAEHPEHREELGDLMTQLLLWNASIQRAEPGSHNERAAEAVEQIERRLERFNSP